jgi:hypothetical protein
MAVVDADLNIARGIRRIVRTVALHVLRDNYRNSCVGVLKTMAKPNQQKNEYARDGYRSAQSQIAQCRCHYSHNRIRRAGDLSPFKSSLWPMLATILIRPCCKGQAAPRALRCASPQFVMNDGENGVTLRQIIVCAARCRFVQIFARVSREEADAAVRRCRHNIVAFGQTNTVCVAPEGIPPCVPIPKFERTRGTFPSRRSKPRPERQRRHFHLKSIDKPLFSLQSYCK